MPLPEPTHGGVLPYLVRDGAVHTVLITNSSGKWVFPKGFIEAGDTPAEAAETEAFEEAGLLGKVHDVPFARYSQAKWGRIFLVEMYLFQVTEILATWDEEEVRERKVLRLDEARVYLRKGLRAILDKAAQVLAE